MSKKNGLDRNRQCVNMNFFPEHDMENVSNNSDQKYVSFWNSLVSAKFPDWLFFKNLFVSGMFSWVWMLTTYAKNIGKKVQKSLAMII